MDHRADINDQGHEANLRCPGGLSRRKSHRRAQRKKGPLKPRVLNSPNQPYIKPKSKREDFLRTFSKKSGRGAMRSLQPKQEVISTLLT